MATGSQKNVFVIELNEFNEELLQAAVKTHSLPALAKVLSFKCTHYRTADRYNSGYLEPWVQWLSIHTSTPASQHRIKHLGDVPDLNLPQCWETFSQYHVTTGGWGLMNAQRRGHQHCRFFLPDPWTFSEDAYPAPLNRVLSLPRYLAKHYQKLNPLIVMAKGFSLLRAYAANRLLGPIIKAIPSLLKAKWTFGKKHFVFISFFEYLSALMLIRYKRKENPRVTFAFFNALAHLQHHHWRGDATTITPELLYGLRYIDRIFAHLFEAFPNDVFVIHNGLSQMNTQHEKPWVLYRQKDPKRFLKAMKIPFTRVEQHMTHDGHVFFKTPEDCIQSFHVLKQARLNDKYLFQVELNAHDPCKLFYQLNYTDPLSKSGCPQFEMNQKLYAFFDYFDEIVTRTGRHMPIGTIYSDTIDFPDQIFNHDFNRYLFHYVLPTAFPLKQEQDLFAEVMAYE